MSDPSRELARSFGTVAETYDRARPSYPAEAAEWLVGQAAGESLRILEIGAGTGKFTELLAATGHQVIATDPSPEMLGYLKVRVPGVEAMVATAEHLPVESGSADVVVVAQAFHWFATAEALAEIGRVLRPGGTLGLVWNVRDTGIPWVRKLGAIIEHLERRTETVEVLRDCAYFDEVAEREYRFWQHLRRDELFDLVRSRSNVATLSEHERADIISRVGALYDDYGRGPDGMKLPYLTRCYKATLVRNPPAPILHEQPDPVLEQPDPVLEQTDASPSNAPHHGDRAPHDPEATAPLDRSALPQAQVSPTGPEDTGTLLIDFR